MSLLISKCEYEIGDLIIALIEAHNPDGWSPISDPNTIGVLAQASPTKLISGLTGTSTTSQIILSWNFIKIDEYDIGYSTLTGYQIQWDSGLGTSTFTNQSFTASLTQTIAATSGLTYKIKVAPVNIHGVGPYSSEFTIIAAEKASDVLSPVVS